MRPALRSKRRGFALLPVVFALGLLAATAYLMTRESAMGGSLVTSAQQRDRARYVAEAALRHASWQVQTSNCNGFNDVSTTPFGPNGQHSYSASVSPTSGSPVTLAATGTLADGTSHTLERTGVAAYEAPSTLILELGTDAGRDTLIDDFYPRNYGGSDHLWVSADPGWLTRALLDFDLSGIPEQARILSATLRLRMRSVDSAGSATVHRVTRDWVEGTMDGGGQPDGATWETHDGSSSWSTPGGEFAPQPVAETAIQSGDTWVTWEIQPLVQEWVDGVPNHGLILVGAAGLDKAEFASKEANASADRPKLAIAYACECGIGCTAGPAATCDADYVPNNKSSEFAPSGLGSSFFRGITTLPSGTTFRGIAAPAEGAYLSVDSEKQLFMTDAAGTPLASCALGVSGTNWSDGVGYVASGPRAGEIAVVFNGTSSDFVQYVDTDCNPTLSFATDSFGAATPSGISHIGTTASGPYADSLAIAERANPDSVHIVDQAGVESLELDVSAVVGDLAGVAHLPGTDRLLLADSANSRIVEIDFVNFDDTALAQYDLATFGVPAPEGLGIDAATCAHLVGSQDADAVATLDLGSERILYVVNDPNDPSLQELARQALMVGWGFDVTLIDDDATQASFDAEAAVHDAAYVSQEVVASSLGTKLAEATIGVVNESRDTIDEFGFADSASAGGGLPTLEIDPSHYITSVFPTNSVAPYTVNEWYQIASTPVAAGVQPVGTWVESPWTGLPALMAVVTGGDLINGRIAAGRRVQIPMGAGQGLAPVDVNGLSDDGRTIIQRSIAWAAGADLPAAPQAVLLVVGTDPPPVPSRDDDLRALIESWNYGVTLIDDSESQASFDAAAAAADVVYVAASIGGGTLAHKLTGSPTPIVNEFPGKLDNFGFSSSTTQQLSGDTFDTSDPAHYISSPFGGTAIGVTTTSLMMPVPGGTLAPDLQVPAGFSASEPALVTLETGARRWDGNPAPARRVHLPFGPAATSQLTGDGRLLMQRAIEWAGGTGAGGGGGGSPPAGGVVFEGHADVNPSTTYNVDVPTPAGTVEGDLLIAAIASDEDAIDLAAPAGWSLIALQAHTTRATLGVWWKLATASEPATHRFTSSRYEMKYGWMMRFSGHDPANPIHATSSFETGSSTDPTVPSTTTTVANALILRIGGFDHEDITPGDPGLAGHTPITMALGGSGLGACAGGAGYTHLPAAGATGTAQFALTAKEEYVTGTIAIAPDPAN